MNIKFCFLALAVVLLIDCSSIKKPCSIKDLSGKCKSEMDAYEDSFDEAKDLISIPIDILNHTEASNKNLENLNKTWIYEHFDQDKMLIGAHYIYWSLESKELKDNILEPVYE